MLGANVRNIRDAINGNQSRGIVGLIRRGYLVVTEKPNRRGGKATTYSVRVPGDEAISASQSRAKDESFSASNQTLYRVETDTFSASQSRALMLKKEESERAGAPAPPALTRGAGAPARDSGSGDDLPLNHDDVEHPESWREWAAAAGISVERPVCKEHPDGDTGISCSGCGRARENLKQWEEERSDSRDCQKDLRDDISACRFCDDHGYNTTPTGWYWCDHQTPPPQRYATRIHRATT
jgi:hypothetical protein